MPTEVLKNNIQTTLLAAIDSNDTVITPTDPTGFPATGERARAAIGDEILIVAGGDGPQYDVTRGAEGTTAVGHAAGDALRLVLTADGFAALAALGSALRVVTRRLTTAELSTLGDTPVELVPGVPGALLMGVSVVGQAAPGTTPFGSAPTFGVTGGSNSGVTLADLSLSSVTAGFNSAVFAGTGTTTASRAGDPIIVTAAANPTVSGAILTSSLDSGGSLYAPGDTGTVDGGNNDATYVVDTVANSYAIVGVNQGTKTFTLQGETDFFPADTLQVYGSTGNDGDYTVASVTVNGGNTDIVVVEAIPTATADGYGGNNSGDAVGALLTYTITDGGTGYQVGVGENLTATTGGGTGGFITIDSVDSAVDMEATFTVAYYVVPVA